MSQVLAIDPGNENSAWVLLSGNGTPADFGYVPNSALLEMLTNARQDGTGPSATEGAMLVIEQVASFGMAVGETVFETVFWSGRFAQAWEGNDGDWTRVKRLAVKMCLCHDSRAKDPNIRQALIDLFGGKEKAVGNKKAPGPLYGISGDVWSALAVAVTYANRLEVADAR